MPSGSHHSDTTSSLACTPRDLRLDRRDGLHVIWGDGRVSHYPLRLLRENCPCAACAEKKREAARRVGTFPLTVLRATLPTGEAFREARLVGNYALHITWADEHSAGFYDFKYLREIDPAAREPQRDAPSTA